MDQLPIELLLCIFNRLSSSDRLNCALSCNRFLLATLAGFSLPRSPSVRLLLSDCPCLGGVTSSSAETWLALCQCPAHGALSLLEAILPHITNGCESLLVEDELAKGQVSDDTLHAMLANCASATVTKLSLSRCDFAKVRPWTLSMMAQFGQLQELSIDGCVLPLSESQLIRTLSTSFHSLRTLEVKDCKLITDKLARSLSRGGCPHLETLCVSGCPSVSAFSALSLLESARHRRSPALTVHMENTAFQPDMLDRYMRSPLFSERSDWRLRAAYVEIGYERQAVLAEHTEAMCVLIYV